MPYLWNPSQKETENEGTVIKGALGMNRRSSPLLKAAEFLHRSIFANNQGVK